jgi:hypothetical protein
MNDARSIKPMPTEATEDAILRLLDVAGPGRTISPTDVARALHTGPDWNVRMPQVRRAAIALALAGRIVIYRKGRPVDPNVFKGIYRLGLARQD